MLSKKKQPSGFITAAIISVLGFLAYILFIVIGLNVFFHIAENYEQYERDKGIEYEYVE